VATVGVAISVACGDVLSTQILISIFVLSSYTYYIFYIKISGNTRCLALFFVDSELVSLLS